MSESASRASEHTWMESMALRRADLLAEDLLRKIWLSCGRNAPVIQSSALRVLPALTLRCFPRRDRDSETAGPRVRSRRSAEGSTARRYSVRSFLEANAISR